MQAALASRRMDQVVVSSDDTEIADVARRHGRPFHSFAQPSLPTTQPPRRHSWRTPGSLERPEGGIGLFPWRARVDTPTGHREWRAAVSSVREQ
jgi:hypothetical protein